MKKNIKFKHIIVGCMMAAILAVPVMAFAAPNASDAAAADTPAVTEQAPDIADSATIPDADVQPADGETTDDAAATGSSTPVYYYIVGGCVVALGVGFYIALSLKQKRR